MKAKNLYQLILFVIMQFALSSCAVIGDIFKTGMGVGAFAVVLIIVLVIFFFSRAGKK